MSGIEPLVIGMALTAVAGVVGAVGQVQEAEATAKAQEANAETALMNREIADQDRRLAMDTAQIDAADKHRENTRTMASIRAAYGVSGGELFGSPLDVLQDTALELETDTSRTLSEGRARNREGALAMLGFQRDASMSTAAAKGTREQGWWSAAGTALNTGAKLVRMI